MYQPTPDISSNLRRHRKKINFWLSHAIKQCPILKNCWAGSLPNMHKTIQFQSVLFAISHLSFLTYWGPWPDCTKKNLYIIQSIGILKSPWPRVSLHSVYQILMLTYDSCFTVKLHVHSYFCLEEISDRVFKTSQPLIMLTNMFILKVVLFLKYH